MNLLWKTTGGFIALLGLADCAASDRIRIHDSPQPDIVPYQLVVDAGVAAKELSDDPGDQLSFISGYAGKIEEVLLYGYDEQDHQLYEKKCREQTSMDVKIFYCSRAAAIDALVQKKITVELEDFGYTERVISGKVFKEEDAAGYFAETSEGSKIRLIMPKGMSLKAGESRTFEGYMSLPGAYGPRGGLDQDYQFLVRKVKE